MQRSPSRGENKAPLAPPTLFGPLRPCSPDSPQRGWRHVSAGQKRSIFKSRPRSPMLGTTIRPLTPLRLHLARPLALLPATTAGLAEQTTDRLPPVLKASTHRIPTNMSNGAVANGSSAPTHTASQRYLSTRGNDSGVGGPCSSPSRWCRPPCHTIFNASYRGPQRTRSR